MFQIDLNSIIQLFLILMIGYITVKAGRFLDRVSMRRENPSPIEPKPVSNPIPVPENNVASKPIININNNEERNDKKKIMLEIEFPELPEKIILPYEKLPELYKLIGEKEQKPQPLTPQHGGILYGVEASINKEEAPEPGGGSTKSEEAPKKPEEIDTYSFAGHGENPWLDIVSRVSGLKFSGDGKKVYCPRHGWVNYIVTSDGRILCGYDYHELFDPNKPKSLPVKEVQHLQKEISELSREIQELRDMAQMDVRGISKTEKSFEKAKPGKEEYEEEEYGEEEE